MTYYSTPHSLPAPLDSDPVASYASIARALVDKLDDDVLGTYVNSAAGTAAATGWSIVGFRGIKMLDGRFAWVDFVVSRTGATLTATANGNVTDTDAGQVPAAFRPARRQYVQAARSSLGFWQCFIEANTGMLVVCAGPPTATIAAGDNIQCQAFIELL